MLVVAAALISLGCVAASAQRLRFVLEATYFDLTELHRALLGDAGRARGARLRERLETELEPGRWEHELAVALGETEPGARLAAINEASFELQYRLERWMRVPRVCASIASSGSFLLATLALRSGLSEATAGPDEGLSSALNGVVVQAIGVAAVGAAGTITCIALQMQARRVARAQQSGADKLVERFEAVLD